MAYKVTRKKQFAQKIETTAGTKETLSASDYGLELDTLSFSLTPDAYQSNNFSGSIDHSEDRMGKCVGACNIGGELKGSGTLNTAPKLEPTLLASRLEKSNVVGLAFTGATGTSARGLDIITGGTSGASGRLIKIEGSKIYLSEVDGAFTNGETLTDSLGTWTATAGATDAGNTGMVYKSSSSDASEKCITVFGNEDGIAELLYGGVANFALDLSTEGLAKFTGTITGIVDKDVYGTAVAMLDDTTITWEDVNPSVVNNASLTIGSFAPVGVNRVTVDLGNAPVLVDDLNSSTWLNQGVVTTRGVNGTLDVMAIDPSEYNVYQAFMAGTKAQLAFTIGSGAGKTIEVLLPQVQYTGVSNGDRNSFLTNALTFKAVGKDKSFFMWFR